MMVQLGKKHITIWLVLLFLWPCMCIATAAVETSLVAKPGCNERCGDVIVPYPFGIDKPDCAKNKSFLLNCNLTLTPPKLYIGRNVFVYNISVENSTVTVGIYAAGVCYTDTGITWRFDQQITWLNTPLTFSDTLNKFTALGCDNLALMNDADGGFGGGCFSFCGYNKSSSGDGSCSGFGCCQTPIPKHLKTLNMTLTSLTNASADYSPTGISCSYAFLSNSTYNISEIDLFRYPSVDDLDQYPSPPVVLDWVVGKDKCEASEGPSGYEYACGDTGTLCSYNDNGGGFRCLCMKGYFGNPYLRQGCQDIDECKDPNTNPCHGTCKNKQGNYTCSCPLGMHGDGKVACYGVRLTTIVTVIGAISSIVIIIFLIFILYKRRRREKNFINHGGSVLENQRVRIFEEEELIKATKNYSDLLGQGGFGSVYKGVLADTTQIAVKKPRMDKKNLNNEFQHEIRIISQVNHKNVVKLLGLCLHTDVPLLVYEYISNGTLSDLIHKAGSNFLKSWKNCLRIAEETASALNYLHSLADPPIIHRDVKSANILLDKHHTAKVSDFGASVLIPTGQNGIYTTARGTPGYLDPEYLTTCNLTAKSDVYSFGVVLIELLTGQNPGNFTWLGERSNLIQHFRSSIENNNLFQILNFEVVDRVEKEQIQEIAELAMNCVNGCGENRPPMMEVAEVLGKMMKVSQGNLLAQHNSEETKSLASDLPFSSRGFTNAPSHMGCQLSESRISETPLMNQDVSTVYYSLPDMN